jgi:hypothetical protein
LKSKLEGEYWDKSFKSQSKIEIVLTDEISESKNANWEGWWDGCLHCWICVEIKVMKNIKNANWEGATRETNGSERERGSGSGARECLMLFLIFAVYCLLNG